MNNVDTCTCSNISFEAPRRDYMVRRGSSQLLFNDLPEEMEKHSPRRSIELNGHTIVFLWNKGKPAVKFDNNKALITDWQEAATSIRSFVTKEQPDYAEKIAIIASHLGSTNVNEPHIYIPGSASHSQSAICFRSEKSGKTCNWKIKNLEDVKIRCTI